METHPNKFEELEDWYEALSVAQTSHYPAFYTITDRTNLTHPEDLRDHQVTIFWTLITQFQALAKRHDAAKSDVKKAGVYDRSEVRMKWYEGWKHLKGFVVMKDMVERKASLEDFDTTQLSMKNSQIRQLFLDMAKEVKQMENRLAEKKHDLTVTEAVDDNDLISLVGDASIR